MKTPCFAGASLIALALTAQPALAQSRDSAKDTIVVTGERSIDKAIEEIAQRPGGADLVTAEEYQDKLAVSLRDALAFSPGVYAQPRFGQEVRLSIRGSGISRGFHMRGIMLLQDGIPINLADGNGDFQELDPFIFQHIEVYRGANALRFGGSSLGGAINAVTPTGRSAPGFRARIDGGSFDTIRAKLTGGFSDSTGDAWFAVTGDSSDGSRDHARRNSLRFHGNVGLRLSPTIETRFYASAQTIDQELPGGLPLAVALTKPETGNFFGDQARDIDSLRLQNRTSLKMGDAALELGAFLNAKELYHPIFQVFDQKSSDYGAYARLKWATGPLELTLGATGQFGTVDARRYVNIDGKRGALTLDAEQSARTFNLYGEARYNLGVLSLIAGGIYTHGTREQRQTFPVVSRGNAAFDQFSPKLGLLWEPREGLQFYANYSRSHELPGFIELAQVTGFVSLDSQRAWTAEVGARGEAGIASFDISFYRSEVEGELLQFSVGPNIPATTFNANDTLHQGIELGLDLQLAPWARLRQVYQFNDFRFDDDPQYGDNRLPVVPQHLYRAKLRLGDDELNIAPNIEWVPEGAWADYTNSLKVDGYVLIGITAEAKLSEGIALFVDARNLTGEDEVGDISAVIDYQSAPAFRKSIFYPVQRRAVFGGVCARF